MTVRVDESTVLALVDMVKSMQIKMNEMSDTIQNDHSKKIGVLKGLLDEQRESNKQLISDLKNEKDSNERLKSELYNKNNEIRNKEREIMNKDRDITNKDRIIDQMESRLKEQSRRNDSLKDEIRHLKSNSQNWIEKYDDLNKEIRDKYIYLYDKGKYYEVDIRFNKMSYDQKNFAMEVTRKSLNMYSNHFESAKYIKERFENRYDGKWCAIIGVRGYGNSCFSYYNDCYICFAMGEFLVDIFKANS